MIKINTILYPYRMNLMSKDPVELTINIKNISLESKLLSINILLDRTLCFDKNGLKKIENKRLGDLKSNESKIIKYNIYPFQGIKSGLHKITIKVNEHYSDYLHLTDMTEKVIYLKVVD